jgi:allantoicase
MFPDGGFTRLGLFAEAPAKFPPLAQARCERFEEQIPKSLKPLTIPYAPSPTEIASNHKRARSHDRASLALGARVLRASNEHYGPAAQVISPFPPLHMFDGLESARSRKAGHFEEVDIALAQPTQIDSVQLDFTYFVNNNPLEISLFGRSSSHEEWKEVLPRVPVKAYAGNVMEIRLPARPLCVELRVRTHPDGGINRIKVRGEAPPA